MAKMSPINLPEVFLSTSDVRRTVSRWVEGGQVRKIAPRLYTRNLTEAPEAIIRRNLWPVVSLLFPGTIVSHRTALEMRPTPDGTVNLTGDYARFVRLSGLSVRVLKGPKALPDDTPFMQLTKASETRALLECLRPSRGRGASAAGLRREEVEKHLERRLASAGETALNRLRDRAADLAPALKAEAEAETLNQLIGALLGSRDADLTAPAAIARAQGEPYDTHRLETFQLLLAHLVARAPVSRLVGPGTDAAFANVAFFDSYFSNYIEGTEFEIDEAIEIVFQQRIPEERPEDAHDVLGTFRVAGSRDDMGRSAAQLPSGYDDFERMIRARHATIMEARPDKMPREFKKRANRAGETPFVEPALVRGTLRKGYEIFRAIEDPFARAAFMMFLISEVHPFVDGNGRVGRLMMNAELVAADEVRIIIPTVYRDDYVQSLRELTRNRRPEVFVKALDRAQELVRQIDFSDLGKATEILRRCNAFEESTSARLRLPSELTVSRSKAPM